MSRSYATDEQYERWFMAECCRCRRRRHKAGSWPDGFVCRTCSDRAVRTRGVCPGCGQERALPGCRATDGAAICTTCAGFSQSFACTRCGVEDKLHGGRLCTRCTFADRLVETLDDGSGRIRPELAPLADSLLAMDNPLSGLTWLYARKGHAGSADDLLRRLGRGEIALTHEAFHTLQPWRAAAHLRDLLMSCGVLPTVDKQICSFERWLVGHLADISDPDHVQLVRRFATWEVLPRLRTRAEKKPITPASRRHAGDQVKHAAAFLRWLCERGLILSTCRQADIDAWHIEHNEHGRNTVRAFLLWCMANKLTRRFRLPAAVVRQATSLPQSERLDLSVSPSRPPCGVRALRPGGGPRRSRRGAPAGPRCPAGHRGQGRPGRHRPTGRGPPCCGSDAGSSKLAAHGLTGRAGPRDPSGARPEVPSQFCPPAPPGAASPPQLGGVPLGRRHNGVGDSPEAENRHQGQ